jgi:hypothetical protein
MGNHTTKIKEPYTFNTDELGELLDKAKASQNGSIKVEQVETTGGLGSLRVESEPANRDYRKVMFLSPRGKWAVDPEGPWL